MKRKLKRGRNRLGGMINKKFIGRSVSKKEFNLKVSNYSAHEITSKTIDEMFDNLTYKIEVLR